MALEAAVACPLSHRSPVRSGQRHASEADAELFQRRAARDRLSQALGEFIELVAHGFPFRSSSSG